MKILLFALFAANLWAQDFDSRMREAYFKNDKRADLSCFYYNPDNFKMVVPQGATLISTGSMHRSFELVTGQGKTSIDFKVYLDRREEARYSIQFENGLRLEDEIDRVKEREFYLDFTSDYQFNADFEISKIYCAVNFAQEPPLELNEKKIHLNVHPHTRYDYMDLTTSEVNRQFRNSQWKSYVLLEEGNFKGNLVDLEDFLTGKPQSLPQNFYESNINPIEETELVVSPAGHNRFVVKTNQNLQILYTGGNHNYCIWNNTRNLLYAYLRSPYEHEVEIVYDTQAIVAQRKGIIRGLSFSWRDHRKSNLLSDLFTDRSAARKYHQKYHDYFLDDYLSPFKGLFSQLIFEYESSAFTKTSAVQGSGVRNLKIKLRYK